MDLESGQVTAWRRRQREVPHRVQTIPARSEHNRHSRRYAEGNLSPDDAFCFRGPEGKLRLTAQNLTHFLQIGEGVDDDTWCYHLQRGDYSKWFRDAIKDDDLSADTATIEREHARGPANQSRAAIRAAIEKRYTLPSEAASGQIARM
jgi:hypothetical protein